MLTAAMRKGGRPRKQGVPRTANGRIASGFDRAQPDDIKSVALEARARQVLGVDEFLKAQRQKRGAEAALLKKRMDDPLLGYALGRLRYSGEIDGKQHDAGSYFIWLWKANARVRGWPSPNVRSIGADMAASGLSTHPEESDEWIADIKRKWSDTYRFIMGAQRDFGPIFEILKRTIVEDIGPQNAEELGNLKIGLNAINSARGA